APSHTDQRRFPIMVLNTLLGGNMSSRLFQEVREKRGLAYSIYSFFNTYADVGVLGVYAGTTPEELPEVLELISKELRELGEGKLSEGEVAMAKEYLKGGMVLSLENPEGRMVRLAKNEIYFGRYIPPEETLRQIEGVSLQEVLEVGRELLDGSRPCVVMLGEVQEGQLLSL
ncbi:TPA: insulinase family protein, partial [Candidatus Bipolaricaulota bacterium]|nr:insulinase family protein [Candidatus Bipolaricaulota bacterium]